MTEDTTKAKRIFGLSVVFESEEKEEVRTSGIRTKNCLPLEPSLTTTATNSLENTLSLLISSAMATLPVGFEPGIS